MSTKTANLQLDVPELVDDIADDKFWKENLEKIDSAFGAPNGYQGRFQVVEEELTKKTDQSDFVTYVNLKNRTSAKRRTHFHLYDSFARPDSTTSLGNAETNNLAYTLLGTGTTWGILNNEVYVVSATSGNRTLAYQETNEPNGVLECEMKHLTVGSPNPNGVSFRITDDVNYWSFAVKEDYTFLMKVVAGVVTVSHQVNTVEVLGRRLTDCKVSIVMDGNKIECYVDGFLLSKVYDAFNNTATKHGLYCRGADLTTRWKNLCLKPLGEIPFNFKKGFEQDLPSWYWEQEHASQSHSLTFSDAIKKGENKSLRLELRKSDPLVNGSHRCEIALPAESPLEEHWYGVNIFLPDDGDEDYANDVEKEIILQWHNIPDSGEEWTSPPLALATYNGNYRIAQLWDDLRLSTNADIESKGNRIDANIGSYQNDKGKWVEWVFHVKWGWLESQEPITEVYKDGVLVYENNGHPNTTNDAMGVYPKLGVYKWEWKEPNTQSVVTKRVVYYDGFFVK